VLICVYELTKHETRTNEKGQDMTPRHDDNDIMDQWRDENLAGNGQSFGDDDDLTCEQRIEDAAKIEGARVLCELNTPDCYLVSWGDAYYVVCDCNGWWACRVTL